MVAWMDTKVGKKRVLVVGSAAYWLTLETNNVAIGRVCAVQECLKVCDDRLTLGAGGMASLPLPSASASMILVPASQPHG